MSWRFTLPPGRYRQLCRLVDERDGGCIICGCPRVDHHHVIARSLGGPDREDNLVCLCRRCHQRYDKDRAMREEFLAYLDSRAEWRKGHADDLKKIYKG